MDKRVTVRLVKIQVEELYWVYDQLHGLWNVSNQHEALLIGHISELRNKLRKIVDRCNKGCSLTLEGTELLAFVQVWEPENIGLTEFQARIIQIIFARLDGVNKQRRVYAES
jgi:hypothetical protein